MEEIFGVIAGIIKGIGLLFRTWIESGVWEISIRKPGRLLLKIIWPPFWFKPIEYTDSFITFLGIIFWCVLAYAYFYIYKITGL